MHRAELTFLYPLNPIHLLKRTTKRLCRTGRIPVFGWIDFSRIEQIFSMMDKSGFCA